MEHLIGPIIIVSGSAIIAAISGLLYLAHWMGKTSHKTSDMAHSLVGLRDVLVSVRDSLASEDRQIRRGKSPLQLTKFGQETADAMKATEWAHRQIKSGQFRTVKRDYEADYYARQIANSDYGEDTRTVVSIGVYESGLDEASVRAILAIVLREEIIKQINAASD